VKHIVGYFLSRFSGLGGSWGYVQGRRETLATGYLLPRLQRWLNLV
jgi:hypothetical protein